MKSLDLKPRHAPEASGPSRSRLFVDPGLANVFRKLCRHHDKSNDEMLEALVRLWVEARAPELELVERTPPRAERRAPLFSVPPPPMASPTEPPSIPRASSTFGAETLDASGPDEATDDDMGEALRTVVPASPRGASGIR